MNETVLERELELICMINSFEVRLNLHEVVSGAANEFLLMRESSVTLNNKQHGFPTAVIDPSGIQLLKTFDGILVWLWNDPY